VAEAAECGSLDEHVRAIVSAAIATERQRTAGLLLEVAERRRKAFGPTDPLVSAFALIANEIADPDR
jgi:hypothetical protein